MLDPTPYSELNEVLEELVASTKSVLGQALVGAYLQGSFAVGDFDRHSDADFVFVVADELSDSQVDALQAVHRRIYGLPRDHLRLGSTDPRRSRPVCKSVLSGVHRLELLPYAA